MDKDRVAKLIRDLLVEIGEDPTRPGLQDTPARVARWWSEFIDYDPGTMSTSFDTDADPSGIVSVGPMRIWSLCEHHLLPFYCDLTITYRPNNGRVLGLSKLARVAHYFGHRLQLQEQLCTQVRDEISRLAKTPDVAVDGSGVHLCMVMRGIRTPAVTRTTVTGGIFSTAAGLTLLRSVTPTGGSLL